MISMGEWLCILLLFMWCLNQAELDSVINKNLIIIDECACPHQTWILECSVTALSQGRSLTWTGSAFDCNNSNDMITVVPRLFPIATIEGTCNDGSIVAHSLKIQNNSNVNSITHTSRLNVKTNPNISGKNITCLFDEKFNNASPASESLTISSITITQEAQYSPSKVEYSVVTTESGSRTITFRWNHFNVSMCPAVPYNILTSNCGICPPTTNNTEVTCTDAPTDAAYCSFALIPTICGGVSPNLSILLDVRLMSKDSDLLTNESRSDLVAACVFLTIVIIALLILISIALLYRFKDYFRRILNHFRFEIPLGSLRLRSNRTRELEPQLQCHYTSQYEEIGSYTSVETNSASNGSILKIFDNKNEEKGIYGIEDDCDQNMTQNTSASCQLQANSQAVNTFKLQKSFDGDNNPPVNLENLLMKFGDEVKSQWYKFGEAIGVSRTYLDTTTGEQESLQCLKNVLDHWIRHHPSQPTWEEATKAHAKIKHLNLVEERDKADDHEHNNTIIDESPPSVPPPKPPRRRSSVNRSHAMSTVSIKKGIEQQENFYDTLK